MSEMIHRTIRYIVLRVYSREFVNSTYERKDDTNQAVCALKNKSGLGPGETT